MINGLAVAWLALCLAFWVLFFFTKERHYMLFYFHAWILGFGIPVWWKRDRIRAVVRGWSARGYWKFLLLGLMMVAIEEVLAALFNHLDEGFRLSVYLQRIGQFELMNLMIFFGLLSGMYLVVSRVAFSEREIFYLAGVVGLYSEKVLLVLFAAPLQFFFFAPLIIFAYGLVVTPAMMSLEEGPRRRWVWIVRYPVLFVASLIGASLVVIPLLVLRQHHPWLLPPASFFQH